MAKYRLKGTRCCGVLLLLVVSGCGAGESERAVEGSGSSLEACESSGATRALMAACLRREDGVSPAELEQGGNLDLTVVGSTEFGDCFSRDNELAFGDAYPEVWDRLAAVDGLAFVAEDADQVQWRVEIGARGVPEGLFSAGDQLSLSYALETLGFGFDEFLGLRKAGQLVAAVTTSESLLQSQAPEFTLSPGEELCESGCGLARATFVIDMSGQSVEVAPQSTASLGELTFVNEVYEVIPEGGNATCVDDIFNNSIGVYRSQ